MSYEKWYEDWKDKPDPSTPIDADALNYFEAALASAHAQLDALNADGGLGFMQKLRFELENTDAGLAGDSTGNFTNEWFDLAAAALGAAHPALRVAVPHYNDAGQAWDAPVVVQPGTAPTVGVKARDTFARTGPELVGTVPDLGVAWSADGANASGDWTLDGTKAVASAETSRGTVLQDMQVAGEMETRVDFTLSTVTAAAARSIRVVSCYKATTDHPYGAITISQSSGAALLAIHKRIGNTLTKITAATDLTSTAIAANTANQSVTARLRREGTTVTFTVTKGGVTDTLTATLTEADVAALEGATKGGLALTLAAALPFTMSLFELSLLSAPAQIDATFWNASVAGTTLAYQQSRIATLFPEPLDVLILSAGHNYGADTPAQFHAKLDAFVAAFHAVQPGVPIVVTSQNPQFAPATNRVAHNKRQASLRAYCRARGFGYVPTVTKWLEQPNKGAALVQADGVHPTVGDTGTGSAFWRDRALEYLNAL